MKTFKINLRIHGSIMTPFQADTLFGHLCWIVRYRKGEIGLQEFLEPFQKKDPPFLISDGFPAGLFPMPLSAELFTVNPQERKELRKTDFISSVDFECFREGRDCRPNILSTPYSVYLVSHNKIDRLTNSTSKEGGVFTLKQTFIPEINIYLKASSEEWKNRVYELLQELSRVGYGKKKSIGSGQFSLAEPAEFDFKAIGNPTGFLSLSNFCPEEDDPTEGLYRTFVKYGKLGEEFTYCGNPFKRPLLMLRAGAVFKTNGSLKEYYGRVIQEGISPAKPEVIQYAYAFPIPIVYPTIKKGCTGT